MSILYIFKNDQHVDRSNILSVYLFFMKSDSLCIKKNSIWFFFSFYNDQGVGVEAFFTLGCQLVVAVSTKKSYYTVALNESPLIDNKWVIILFIIYLFV